MTPKEALKGLCDLSKVDSEDFKMWVGLRHDVEQALTELEELKRDVKSYFELDYQAKISGGIDDVEANKYTRLHIKLLKVGKEE
jgi:hypothetical protein